MTRRVNDDMIMISETEHDHLVWRLRDQQAELERLRKELNERRIAYNTGKEAELARLREANKSVTGSLDRWAAERAHLKARLHRIEERFEELANHHDTEHEDCSTDRFIAALEEKP